MNTLNRSLTKEFYNEKWGTPEQCFESIRSLWAEAVKKDRERKPSERLITPVHYPVYKMLLGQDWRECFTPITSKKELENGAEPYTQFQRVINLVTGLSTKWAYDRYIKDIWGDVVTPKGFDNLVKLLSTKWKYGDDAYLGEKEFNAEFSKSDRKEAESMETVH